MGKNEDTWRGGWWGSCNFMEYESKPERIKNTQTNSKGSQIEPERRRICEDMIKNGVPRDEIREKTGLAEHTITAIRQGMEGLPDKDWKRSVADKLKSVVWKGASKLEDEIDTVSPSQLPVALAILIDKIAILQDQPTAVVEHRMVKITHEDINRMLRAEEIIDITPKPLDMKENANDSHDPHPPPR